MEKSLFKYGINETTIAKFIFAIGIITGHFMGSLTAFDGDAGIRYFMLNCCHLGMFGFIFVSGYGLVASWYGKGGAEYWTKKIKNTYIPAVAANVISLIILFLFYGEKYDRWVIFKEITMFSNLDQAENVIKNLWFIPYIFTCYLVFYLVYSITSNANRKIRIVIWLVASLLLVYFSPECFGLSNTYNMGFVLGVLYAELFREKSENILKCNKCFISLVVLLFLIGFTFVLCGSETDFIVAGRMVGFWPYDLFTNIVFALGVQILLWLSKLINVSKYSAIFLLMGRASLYIYLYQWIFMMRPMACMDDNLHKALIGIVGMVVTNVVAVAIVRVKNYKSLLKVIKDN